MKKIALFSFVSVATFVVGCELVTDFDRSKIPVDGNDASFGGDANNNPFPDAAIIDAQVSDAAVFEGGLDASDAESSDDASSDASDGGG